jgi:ligand-binding sensor domain-containing protein
VAQDKLLPVFHFNRLTTADGLPSNEIRSNVVRDHQGFVWVGTISGLASYDGYSTKVYRNRADDRHSLSSNSIITLHVDRIGRLWIGTFASGLGLYDRTRDRFVNFLPRPADSLWFQGHHVGYIMEDGAGPSLIVQFATR